MTGRMLHRLPKEERRAALRAFVGHPVVLYRDVHRDGSWVIAYTGELLAVATPTAGGMSDQVVVRLRPGFTIGGLDTVSVSASTVAGVRSLAGTGARRCVCTEVTPGDEVTA